MLTPLRDMVLVALRDEATPAGGAIQVVRLDRPPSTHATVLAVGPDVKDAVAEQCVVISRLQGIAIGDDRLLLPESAILATMEDT